MGQEGAESATEGRPRPRFIPSKRFTLALLVFFAFIVQYSQRVNLPIAIVCMIDKPKRIEGNSSLDVPAKSTTELMKELTAGSTTDSAARLATRSATDASDVYRNSTTTTSQSVTLTKEGGFFDEKRFHWEELSQQFLLGAYWAGYIFTQLPGRLNKYSMTRKIYQLSSRTMFVN